MTRGFCWSWASKTSSGKVPDFFKKFGTSSSFTNILCELLGSV